MRILQADRWGATLLRASVRMRGHAQGIEAAHHRPRDAVLRWSAVNIVVDPSSSVPPYEQVRAQLAGLVAGGQLPAGTRLATVRQLALVLGLAANPVARAYRALEADGVIVTEGRRGSYVRSRPSAGLPVADLARDYVLQARTLGLTCPEAVRLVEDAWEG